MRHRSQTGRPRGTDYYQQTLVLGYLCEGREGQRIDLSRFSVGPLQQIPWGYDFLWPLRAPDASLSHWRGKTEVAPGSAVCVQQKSQKSIASTKARLKVWMSTVHSTLMTGGLERRVRQTSAQLVRLQS